MIADSRERDEPSAHCGRFITGVGLGPQPVAGCITAAVRLSRARPFCLAVAGGVVHGAVHAKDSHFDSFQ